MIRHCAVPALALACLLGGCSGGSRDETPAVATLKSAAPAESASADVDDLRPLAATNDDYFTMIKSWEACIRKEGGTPYRGNPKLVFQTYHDKDPKGVAVWNACYPRYPERFDERLRRTDLTAYKDAEREFYRCAKAAGYQLTAPDPTDGSFGLTAIGPQGDAQSPAYLECERKAFAD